MSAEPIPNFRLNAAYDYARRGWRVIPLQWTMVGSSGAKCSCGKPDCQSVGKHPLTPTGLKEASNDVLQVTAWWQRWPAANVGVATGPESGLFVLDVDADAGGFDSLGTLCDEHGQFPDTVEARTGGGGSHIFFRYPAGRVLRNSAGRLGPGLDTRGDGGYVVASPSLHGSGRRYAWKDGCGPADVQLADPPAWLLALLEPPRAAPAQDRQPMRGRDDKARRFLGWALTHTAVGMRNEWGMRLAVQLRDNGIREHEAEVVLREYAQRCPAGDHPYPESDAIATVRSVYQRPPRQPAPDREPPPARRERTRTQPCEPASDPAPEQEEPDPIAPAVELAAHIDGIATGKIVNVPWPWPQLTRLTCALIPGSVTCVCGDPGVGKTFFVLQCLKFWTDLKGENGDPLAKASVFFIEKDRKFHTMRLLAQLEGKGSLTNYEWIRDHGDDSRDAMQRWASEIDRLGAHIHSKPGKQVSLFTIQDWAKRELDDGARVLVVDPITAAAAGMDRWVADDKFVVEAQNLMSRYGASLVLIQHPRKGNLNGKQTAHDMGGGAAYYRFTDTTIWLHKSKQPRNVRFQTNYGLIDNNAFRLFFQLHKTRNGRGAGSEIAYEFGDGLCYAEQGIVLGEGDDDARSGQVDVLAPSRPRVTAGAPHYQDVDF